METLIKKIKFSWQTGQTLIEVMVAIGAGALILSAIVVVVISSLNNETHGINQNQSTKYAEEGLDIMRNLSQTDWNALASYRSLSSYCLAQGENIPNPTPIALNCPGNVSDEKFVREIKMEWDNTICNPASVINSFTNVNVTSTVKWSDGKCNTETGLYCHQTAVSSCFFKPKQPLYP